MNTWNSFKLWRPWLLRRVDECSSAAMTEYLSVRIDTDARLTCSSFKLRGGIDRIQVRYRFLGRTIFNKKRRIEQMLQRFAGAGN